MYLIERRTIRIKANVFGHSNRIKIVPRPSANRSRLPFISFIVTTQENPIDNTAIFPVAAIDNGTHRYQLDRNYNLESSYVTNASNVSMSRDQSRAFVSNRRTLSDRDSKVSEKKKKMVETLVKVNDDSGDEENETVENGQRKRGARRKGEKRRNQARKSRVVETSLPQLLRGCYPRTRNERPTTPSLMRDRDRISNCLGKDINYIRRPTQRPASEIF